MKTYILVHGAWHASWSWDEVVPLLEAKGHRVLAPDLPGHGNNVVPHSQVRMRDYVNCVATLVEQCEQPPILVGHSFAGLILTQVAAQCIDKIERLVYLAAFVPESGDSLFAIAQNFSAPGVSTEMMTDDANKTIALKTERLAELFYNACSQEKQRLALAHIENEPLMPMMTPVRFQQFNYADAPTHYIVCEKDEAIAVQDQKWLAERVKGKVSMLAADHSPFLSAPQALVDLL